MERITSSSEDYLEAIYILRKNHGAVRSVDISHLLDVTKPSVSVAMRKLRESGHIRMASDGLISLLPKGEKIARQTYERHILLRAFLIRLGVDAEIADQDACKLEHYLSRESFAALQKVAEDIHLPTIKSELDDNNTGERGVTS